MNWRSANLLFVAFFCLVLGSAQAGDPVCPLLLSQQTPVVRALVLEAGNAAYVKAMLTEGKNTAKKFQFIYPEVTSFMKVSSDRVEVAQPRPYTAEQSESIRRTLLGAVDWYWNSGQKLMDRLEVGERLSQTPVLINLISAYLESRGVAHAVSISSKEEIALMIEILPDANSPSRLNRWAAEVLSSTGARLAFSPTLSLLTDANAAFDSQIKAIYLPVAAILEVDHYHSFFLHERIHALTVRRAETRQEFKFYGTIFALGDGVIPFTPEGLKGYSKILNFDELEAYYKEIQYVQALYRSQEERISMEIREELTDRIRKEAEMGMKLATQISDLSMRLIRFVEAGQVMLEYKVRGQTVWAELLVSMTSGVNSRIEIPLVKSSGAEDANNEDLLIQQLRLLRDGADQRQREFSQFL